MRAVDIATDIRCAGRRVWLAGAATALGVALLVAGPPYVALGAVIVLAAVVVALYRIIQRVTR